MMTDRPSVQRVGDIFYLDDDGSIIRRVKTGTKTIVGARADHVGPLGYRRVTIDSVRYQAHVVVWALHHGEWPSIGIDHINGDKADNKPSNLRLATDAENGRNRGPNKNNRSGLKGVCYHPETGKWRPRITADRKVYYFGLYETPELAHRAYAAQAERLHGKFAKSA